MRILPVITFIATACLSFAQQTNTGKVIGKLGQTIDEVAIRASATSKAKVYYKSKKFQYLVINPYKEGWLKVLLQNGRNGYVEADKVARLPYDVRAKGTPDANLPTVASTSRGSTTSRTVANNFSRSGSNAGAKGQMLEYSFQFIGTPYKWGGNSLENGIDCSGFVKNLFGKIGVDLPRTARQQALVGQVVERLEDLQPGDRLYFWDAKRGYIGHTGIFLQFRDDHAFFIHSSSGHKGINTDDLALPRWRRILVAARRD